MFFSDQIQTPTITAGTPGATFRFADSSNTLVPGQLQFTTLSNGATAAVFRPSAPLHYDATYTIFVAPSIFDVNGNQLASGITASFTTEPPPPADTTPPQVAIAIQQPQNASAVTQGQILRVVVNSSDNSGVVARVDLMLDGQLVDAKVPTSAVTFLVDTSDLDPGSSHVLTAVATDPAGNTTPTSLSIAIIADTIAPTVTLSTASTILRGQALPVSIQATDDTRVARLDLFLDSGSDPIYTGLIAPYQVSVDTTVLANGPHQLRALATDGAGNIGQANVAFSVRSVTSISLSPSPITLNGTGDTRSLVVTGVLTDGTTTPITTGVTFSSSDLTVAVVSLAGVVTSVAPGTATITATFGSLAPASVTVGDIAAVPTMLTLVSGDNQTGAVGQPLASPFVVKVTDANNRPVPNVPVSFAAITGGGILSVSLVNTNVQGQATCGLTLGPTAGANAVTATAGTLAGSPITLHATGKAPNQPPTLVNPGNQTSVEGASVSLSLAGSDQNGDVLTYSATGLPPALNLNSATGLISGTIAATAAAYPVTVAVSDGTVSTSQAFTWTVTSPLGPFVDLSVAMTATPNPVPVGATLTYAISVTNLGSASATSVIVADTLPAGVRLLTASPGCTSSGANITCTAGSLAPAQTAAFTVNVVTFTPGQITNSVAASSSGDSAPANNTAAAATVVVTPPLGLPSAPVATTELFNPNALNWTPASSMSIPRGGTTLTGLGDGTVLVIGGVNASANPFAPVIVRRVVQPDDWSVDADRSIDGTTRVSFGDAVAQW